ncbi:MAG: hypothetical protein OEL79_05325 [Chromatiales bacterium]|nr:hypothetical protein [Chromatiales bacterium]
MSEAKFKKDTNGLHFAAGAFVGGITSMGLNSLAGFPESDAAYIGLLATVVLGAFKSARDGKHYPQLVAWKNGSLIAAGGLITPIMLAIGS